MLGYLLRRILAAVPVMGVVALFVFLLLRLTPGDPAAILAGDNATPEQLDRIRTSLGLNEPLYAQFFTWIGKLLHGDLGVSLISNVPVLQMIGQRVEPSISIALSTIILSIADRGAARRHRGVETRHLDRPLRDGIVGGRLLGAGVRDRLCSDPDLCHRPALAAGAGLSKASTPASARSSNASSCRPCTLSFIYIALIARMTRAAMLDVLGEDYVRTARAKGIGETGVLLRHALRNAAVPVITVIGSGFALLISGVVVTESVFNLPGIGRLTVDAVLARDYPVIQAMILLTSRHLCRGQSPDRPRLHPARSPNPVLRGAADGDRNPARAVDTGHHAVPAAARLSHLDADHRRCDHLPGAGNRRPPCWRPGFRRTIRCCSRRRSG